MVKKKHINKFTNRKIWLDPMHPQGHEYTCPAWNFWPHPHTTSQQELHSRQGIYSLLKGPPTYLNTPHYRCKWAGQPGKVHSQLELEPELRSPAPSHTFFPHPRSGSLHPWCLHVMMSFGDK